jgi:hypothetical protein
MPMRAGVLDGEPGWLARSQGNKAADLLLGNRAAGGHTLGRNRLKADEVTGEYCVVREIDHDTPRDSGKKLNQLLGQ